MKLKKMQMLAKELQIILDVNPKLKFNGNKREFKNDILEASTLLTEDDELSASSSKILRILKKKEGIEDKVKEVKEEPEEIISEEERARLIKAAKNLNKELGLSPKIKLDGKAQDLKNEILGVATMIKKSDKGIKPSTLKTIKFLQKGGNEEMKVKDKIKNKLTKSVEAPKKEHPVAHKKVEVKVKKASKSGVEKDEFGCRIGSKNNLFIKSLKEKPKTMLQIRQEKWNTTSTTYYCLWKQVMEMGRGQRNPEGVMKIIPAKKN